jgi:hypothetical protein
LDYKTHCTPYDRIKDRRGCSHVTATPAGPVLRPVRCRVRLPAGGFDVTGVDIRPIPARNRPEGVTFIHGDALEYLAEHGHIGSVLMERLWGEEPAAA